MKKFNYSFLIEFYLLYFLNNFLELTTNYIFTQTLFIHLKLQQIIVYYILYN